MTRRHMGGGWIASLNNLRIRRREVIRFTPMQLETRYKLNTMDHKADTDASYKVRIACSCWASKHHSSVIQLVA